LGRNSLSKSKPNKPGALLCPVCFVEFVEVTFDCEIDGVILHDVKALRCPKCQEEVFSPEQQEEIQKRVPNLLSRE
jgi:hypothetical protein